MMMKVRELTPDEWKTFEILRLAVKTAEKKLQQLNKDRDAWQDTVNEAKDALQKELTKIDTSGRLRLSDCGRFFIEI